MNSQLGERAEKLAQALRNDKKQLGNWGEVQLERLLESSGLDKSCYAREENYKSEDGDNLRPDFVIKLPEEKCLIIDSKVSLNSYVDSVNEEDAEAAELLLRNHISNIRNHIKGLAEKSYDSLKDINSPDFVFMFMPIESAYLAAFEADPRLFDFAYDKKIAVVTPNTLLPILRTVSSLWRIDRQNTSTLALAESATKVHTKLMTFLEKFLKLESQLQTAQKTFDDAKGNLSSGRGNLLNLVTDFENKGVKINKELPPALSTEG